MLCLVAQSCPTLCDPMDHRPPGFFVHGDSLGKNTGVGCHAPPTPTPRGSSQPRDQIQVSALQADSLPSEPPEKPKNTEWVPYPFSRGTSWPRNQIGLSCIAGRFFTSWTTQEAPIIGTSVLKKKTHCVCRVLYYRRCQASTERPGTCLLQISGDYHIKNCFLISYFYSS